MNKRLMKKFILTDIAISVVLVVLALSIDNFWKFVLPAVILIVITESIIASRSDGGTKKR